MVHNSPRLAIEVLHGLHGDPALVLNGRSGDGARSTTGGGATCGKHCLLFSEKLLTQKSYLPGLRPEAATGRDRRPEAARPVGSIANFFLGNCELQKLLTVATDEEALAGATLDAAAYASAQRVTDEAGDETGVGHSSCGKHCFLIAEKLLTQKNYLH